MIQQQRLRLADAASAAPFPIFTLGRAYDGLQISRLTLDKRSDSRAPFLLEPRIFFGYARGSIDGTYELDLTERRADGEQAQRELAAHRGEGTQHDVVIDGVERPAYVLVGDGKPVYFGVVADGTLITGRANLAVSDTLAMLESLRRLN